ncbi:MAG TPA: hypothetical protein VLB45_06890 [Nitrosopumilaceae archaeon]|nr:hypothetical protein [Nitrosopumilaceae archaeon]
MSKPAQRNRTGIYFAVAVVTVVVFMMTAVFPVWNLIPREVTETVKIVSVDDSGCVAETPDKFLIKIGPCTSQPGESITVTYDEKIKERARAFLP